MNNNLCKNILPKVKQFDPLIFYYRGYSEVSRKKKKKNPFREAFGRVKDLRSVLPGIPLLALTATVQSNERAKLIKASGMVQPIIVDVSPNKENIMFNAIFVPDEKEEVTHLKWIADMVAVKGKETPQTIVFCNTFNDIANILSYLLLVLKEKAFTEDSNGKKKALLGVYHAKSWDSQKVSIEDDFKSDGIQRVVIATCALGMGINFPQVRYVVQYGPPPSIVDLMQQAGRGGRDGSQAHCVAYFTKRQLSRCGKEVKSVVKSEECQRQALYRHFSDSVTPLYPGHLCCSNCRIQCTCGPGDDKCEGIVELFMKEADKPEESHNVPVTENTRTLTPEDKNDLKLALLELQSRFSGSDHATFLDPTASHGFTEQLVNDIVKNAASIFTFDHLQHKFSIYSTQHIMDVLEVFQELFEDIPDYDQQMEVLDLLKSEVARAEIYLQAMELEACLQSVDFFSDDSDTEFLLSEFDLQF